MFLYSFALSLSKGRKASKGATAMMYCACFDRLSMHACIHEAFWAAGASARYMMPL